MREIRIYLARGSCWIIFLSPLKLNAEVLKQCVEEVVDQRRLRSSRWAFANTAEVAPRFAAPGFYKLARLVERLRRVKGIVIPKLGAMGGGGRGEQIVKPPCEVLSREDLSGPNPFCCVCYVLCITMLLCFTFWHTWLNLEAGTFDVSKGHVPVNPTSLLPLNSLLKEFVYTLGESTKE